MNEMARRQYYGSLASYAGAFTQSAAAGQLARISHFNETIGNINRIRSTGISSDLIYAFAAASNSLSIYENRAPTASVNDCSGYCTGLCISQCSTGCKNGCSGGCGSGCSSSCTGSCTNSCAQWCGEGCDNYCATSCGGSNGCRNSCTSGCAEWR